MVTDQAMLRRATRLEVLLLLLMAIVILLMVSLLVLFIWVNQMQREVLIALEPLQAARHIRGLEAGTPAPPFALPDTTGRTISLETFTGRPILLAFTSPHCPACVEMYPHLRTFSERHREVQVVMISRGTIEENQRLIEEQGFDFPVLSWKDEVAQAYQVPGTPFFYTIDRKGVIQRAGFANSLETLEALTRSN